MMARSEEKARKAIDGIRAASPTSSGILRFIRLDLSDLTTIQTTVDEFHRHEKTLHLLFNNAGVGYPEKGSKSKQGYELQLGVNCVGPFALTKLLTPTLVSTAKKSSPASVRVIWVSSSAAEAFSPNGFMESLPRIEEKSALDKYSITKLGNYLHAVEFAERHKADSVISVPLNPGALDSEFWRSQGRLVTCLLKATLLHPPRMGAYTNLFAALSPEVTLEKSGSYGEYSGFHPRRENHAVTNGESVAPWGTLWQVSKDMLEAARPVSRGGSGVAQRFWEWTDAQMGPLAKEG